MECSICYQIQELQTFQALLCGHTFCVDCLQQLQRRKCDSEICESCDFIIKCPSCRCITNITQHCVEVDIVDEIEEIAAGGVAAAPNNDFQAELMSALERFKEELLLLRPPQSLFIQIAYDANELSVNGTVSMGPSELASDELEANDDDEIASDRSH